MEQQGTESVSRAMNSRRASQESQGLAVGWVDRVEEAKDV